VRLRATRRYVFPAAHVLAHPGFSDEENARIYGKCANPAGHGHDYGVEVTLEGEVGPSGHLVDPELLDRIVGERVLARFSHRLLNRDPLFAERVPTAENVARVIHERIAGALRERSQARLVRVRIEETRRNSFAYGEP